MLAFLTARLQGLALAAVCCAAGAALAAPPPPTALTMAGDPLDAAAAVPPLPDIDAFAGYQSFRDEPVASWRDSNAAVAPRPRGGMPDGHGDHRDHGGAHDDHAPRAEPVRPADAGPRSPVRTAPAEPLRENHREHHHDHRRQQEPK
ncbi:hypothetical protein L602_002200000130 [Cupriavidus gilardii J11]|uniref:Uncharacterized protein n=1 Tax=Cupriavidus gilardii J11 TaxID=936133 RepID=A0A562BL38_9BURK|nr:hypothetical protein [Cupriavidus gilardii]TWG85958.1 hypothetical protein L602_002200000130 [Cupriavidus gilardii J11]